MLWYSITYGEVTTEEMILLIKGFIAGNSLTSRIIVGSDSQNIEGITRFVTVVAVTTEHKGGIFFYIIDEVKRVRDIKHRLRTETFKSLSIMNDLMDKFIDNEIFVDTEIHLDYGHYGKSSEVINELVGYVSSMGYTCRIKPDSFVASSIADRLSKPEK